MFQFETLDRVGPGHVYEEPDGEFIKYIDRNEREQTIRVLTRIDDPEPEIGRAHV